MERIQVLIDKLQQQNQQNDGIEQLMATVQLLQNELASHLKSTKALGTSKVSVILPVTHIVSNPQQETTAVTKALEPEYSIRKEEVKPAPKPLTVPQPEYRPEPKPAEYSIPKPKVEVVPEPLPAAHAPYYNGHSDAVIEAPTLVQQQIHREVHELITNHQESLNDKLKEDRVEVAHKLKETPVKDLRKAIGINDKFTLINELFRGDEAMYDRSIKTINSFHILQEAEYWINRELKVKLGWNDSKENVQHFYQLVRRRFS
jgi:hypothetical protein